LVVSEVAAPGRGVEERSVLVPLGRAFRGAIKAFERDTGVGAPRWFLLEMIAGEEGLSQGDVCRRFEQDPSRITRLAQALEADGLVRRERDGEDSRVVRLYLTDEGRGLVGTFPGRREAFERRVERAMSEGELRELRRLLGLLDAAMKN
jgi:DNA-binding MarR family transcriptional regulator